MYNVILWTFYVHGGIDNFILLYMYTTFNSFEIFLRFKNLKYTLYDCASSSTTQTSDNKTYKYLYLLIK